MKATWRQLRRGMGILPMRCTGVPPVAPGPGNGITTGKMPVRLMGRMPMPLARLHNDQRGQATLEWVILMVGFGLPLVYIVIKLLGILAEHYRMVTFLETLPFP